MTGQRPDPVTAKALPLPVFERLRGRRVILASSSPNRKEAMERMGLQLEIIPSTFPEDLPHSDFKGRLAEYPVETAKQKGIEVFERVSREDGQAPDLVISGDTVVIYLPQSQADNDRQPDGIILEKPSNEAQQLEWLKMLNGQRCKVASGVTIVFPASLQGDKGNKVLTMASKSHLKLADNPLEILEAYVISGEGMTKAAGFDVRGLGSILVEETSGDYHNCVGFPTSACWRWMNDLYNQAGQGGWELVCVIVFQTWVPRTIV